MPPITRSTSLAELAERFLVVPYDRLPVVEAETGVLLGTVSKRDLMRVGRY